MHKYTLIPVFLCLLILTGAGCDKEETQTQKKSANPPGETTTETSISSEQTTSNITLTATSAGKGRVRFIWSAPDAMNKENGFRILRGPAKDPQFPGNFWYHPKGAITEAHWIDLPKGTHHFRVCSFEQTACTAYSNDIEVVVE